MKSKKIMSLVAGLGLVLAVILNSGYSSPEPEVVKPKTVEQKVSEDRFGELTKLADKYETDKGSMRHSYAEVYECFFYPTRIFF